MELAQRSRATALHQYIRLLAGQALVEGIDQVLAPALLADSLGTGPQARAFLWKSGLVSRDARTVTLLEAAVA